MLAIYAVALHVVLLGLAPISANAAVDPFSVICHSVTNVQGDEAPKSGLIPGHACEHCNSVQHGRTSAGAGCGARRNLGARARLGCPSPGIDPGTAGVTSDPKLARGPPRLA